MVRSSTRFINWKDRKRVCAGLRKIYTAANVEAAESALEDFEQTWGDQYPMIGQAWRKRWDEITPFLSFPPEMRRAVYTTNAIEALNRQLRKIIKSRGAFPTDEAATKLLFLALRNAQKTWGRPFPQFRQALAQFAIYFGDRISL
jgi:transposase-like protein